MPEMSIARGPDAPDGVRVTIGEKPGAGGHYFLIYCGNREAALAALAMGIKELSAFPDLPVPAATAPPSETVSPSEPVIETS